MFEVREQVAEKLNLPEHHIRVIEQHMSIDFAAHDWGGSGYPPAYAWVKLSVDGTANVITGIQDTGTGTRTTLMLDGVAGIC